MRNTKRWQAGVDRGRHSPPRRPFADRPQASSLGVKPGPAAVESSPRGGKESDQYQGSGVRCVAARVGGLPEPSEEPGCRLTSRAWSSEAGGEPAGLGPARLQLAPERGGTGTDSLGYCEPILVVQINVTSLLKEKQFLQNQAREMSVTVTEAQVKAQSRVVQRRLCEMAFS